MADVLQTFVLSHEFRLLSGTELKNAAHAGQVKAGHPDGNYLADKW